MIDKKKIITSIDDVSKDNPFGVPEHYFDNFTIRMADKISESEDKKAPVEFLSWIRPQLVYITATSVILFIIFGINIWNYSSSKKISVHELRHNIEFSILSEMDENELISQLVASENNSVPQVDSLTIKNQHENSARLIDYLSKEDLDANTIEDAL